MKSRDEPLPLLAFKYQLGDVFVDVQDLEFVREIREGDFCISEEAKYHMPGCDDIGKVVVKSYRPHVINSTEDTRDITHAAKRIHGLQNRYLNKLLGMGCYHANTLQEVRGSVFYIEQFAGPQTLFKLIKAKRAHPHNPQVQYNHADSMRWCVQLTDALAYLHSQGCVHGDIQAANLFLTSNVLYLAEVRLADLKPHQRLFFSGLMPPKAGRNLMVQSTLARREQSFCKSLSVIRESLRGMEESFDGSVGGCTLPPSPATVCSPLAVVLGTMSAPLSHSSSMLLDDDQGPMAAAASFSTSVLDNLHALGRSKSRLAKASWTDGVGVSPHEDLDSDHDVQMFSGHHSSRLTPLRMPGAPLQSQHSNASAFQRFSWDPSDQPGLAKTTSMHSTDAPSMISYLLELQQEVEDIVSRRSSFEVGAINAQGPRPKVHFQNNIPAGVLASKDVALLYSAPEVILHKRVTEKADVFAFGKVMYELLSQSLIHPGEESRHCIAEYAHRVAKEGYREPLPEWWPNEIKQLISECWQQNPNLRPAMSDVHARVKALEKDEKVLRILWSQPAFQPEPSPPPSPSSHAKEVYHRFCDCDNDGNDNDDDDVDDDAEGQGERGTGSGRDRQRRGSAAAQAAIWRCCGCIMC